MLVGYVIGAVYITVHHHRANHLRRACHLYSDPHTKDGLVGASLFLATSLQPRPSTSPLTHNNATMDFPANPAEAIKYASPFLARPNTIPRI
jgi:hypothetical protein